MLARAWIEPATVAGRSGSWETGGRIVETMGWQELVLESAGRAIPMGSARRDSSGCTSEAAAERQRGSAEVPRTVRMDRPEGQRGNGSPNPRGVSG
jgi:hypothetical protein